MPRLAVPSSGMSLNRKPDASSRPPAGKPVLNGGKPFAVRINLTEKLLEELAASKKGSPLMLMTGKNMSLVLGTQTHFEVLSTDELVHHELYEFSSSTDPLQFTGVVQKKLEVLEMEEKSAERDDSSLLALKNQIAAHDQHKKSRSAVFVDDLRALPPALSGRRGLAAARKAGFHKSKNSLTTQSMPSSPSLHPVGSPALGGVMSAPKKYNLKRDPLYFPLIHLLALGSDTEKRLAMKTHTAVSRCTEILLRIGNRAKAGNHWELTDVNYKDLDVWKFPYSAADREVAISHATKAFDRLRLSRVAPEREMLRKPEDRGKPLPEPVQPTPKLPSLSQASPPQPPPPSIKISKEEEVSPPPPVAAPEPMARSLSTQPGLKPRKVSEKETFSKMLLGKKTAPPPKPKAKVAVVAPKDKKVVAIAKEAKPGRKGAAKEFKTPEFIIDSDSDSDDVNLVVQPEKQPAANTLPPRPHPQASPKVQSASSKPPNRSPLPPAPSKLPSKPPSKPPSQAPTPKATTPIPPIAQKTLPPKVLPQKPVPQKTLPKEKAKKQEQVILSRRSASSSPRKPSPLGASFPLNASDKEEHVVSSASSSPLSSVHTADEISTPTPPAPAYTSSSTSATHSKSSSKPRYIPGNERDDSPPPISTTKKNSQLSNTRREITTKAPRELSSSSSDSSEPLRKRKLDTERSENPKKKIAKPTITDTKIMTNGNIQRKRKAEEVEERQSHGGKRPAKAPPSSASSSYASSVASTSSRRSEIIERPMSNRSNSPQLSERTIAMAQKFREYYAMYSRLYKEVSLHRDTRKEKVNEVRTLHRKLESMKARINASMA